MGELFQKLLAEGVAEERPPSETPALDFLLDRTPKEPKKMPEVTLGAVAKKAAAETSWGLGLRATGAWDYQDEDLGWVGNTAAMLGSLVADPVTYVSGGVGGAVARGIAAKAGGKLLERGAVRLIERAAVRGIAPAATFAAMTLSREPLQQYIKTGDVKWLQTARETAKSALLGALTGAAGGMGAFAVPAEIATLTVGGAALEGRPPTGRDLGDATAMVVGMRLVGKMTGAGKRLLLKDYRERLAAGQGDPIPNLELREEAGIGDATRKETGFAIEELIKQEAENAKVEVSDVRGDQGQVLQGAGELRSSPSEGGGNYPQQGEAGAAVKRPQEAPQGEVGKGTTIEDLGREFGMDPSTWRPEPGTEAVPAPPLNATEPGGPTAPPEASRTVSVASKSQMGIRNEITDRLRQQWGLPPRMTVLKEGLGPAWDKAMQRIEENPAAQDILIQELKDKPKPHSNVEVALLSHREAEIELEIRKVNAERSAAEKAGDTTTFAERDAHLNFLVAKGQELIEVGEKSGTETARGLQARQLSLNDDMDLVPMLAAERKSRGTALLPSDAIGEVTKLNEKFAKVQADLAASEAKVQALEASQVAAQAMKDLGANEKPKRRAKRLAAAQEEVEAAWKDLEGKMSGKLFANIDPDILLSMVKVAKAYIKLGVVKVGDFVARVGERMGTEKADALKAPLEQAFNAAMKESQPQPRTELKNRRQVSNYARELSRFFIETAGIKEIEPLVDLVHPELVKVAPGITRNQTYEAISRYRDFSPPTKDEIELVLIDLSGQALEISKLNEMEVGISPGATGKGRPPPSDAKRRLTKRVNEAKKAGNFTETDPDRQLKTTLGTIRTRLTNEIADMEEAIASGERILRKRGRKEYPELRELVQRRDEIKKRYTKIFEEPGLTDAQRTERAIKASERDAVEWERKAREKDIGPMHAGTGVKVTPALEAVRARRDAAKAEVQALRDLANPKKTVDERNTSIMNAAIAHRIANMRDRLARGDFAPTIRIPAKPNEETEKLRVEEAKIKIEWFRRLAHNRWDAMSPIQKVFHGGGEVLNTARSVLTAFDFSAVLRQGGFVVSGHPIIAFKNLGAMFRSFASEGAALREMGRIAKRKNFHMYKQGDLALTDLGGKRSRQEEAYMGSEWARYLPGVKASERAYVVFLNRLRADLFDSMAASLGQSGKISAAQAKVLANYVNVATGRGDLGRFTAAGTQLATVFFAPRYVTSRFQLLILQPLWRGDMSTRKAIATEYARAIVGVGIFYAASSLALQSLLGKPGKKEAWDLQFDPRSADFGKIRIGDTRIDPLMGLGQSTVLIARLTSGQTKTAKGKLVPIRGKKVPYGGATGADVVFRFVRTKLSPVMGATVNVLAGEDVVGRPTTIGTLAENMLVPISMQDIRDAMRAQNVPVGTAASLLGIFGMGVQTYSTKKKKAG